MSLVITFADVKNVRVRDRTEAQLLKVGSMSSSQLEEILTTEAGTFRVRVKEDPYPDENSPRGWTNVGTMVTAHNRYDLPCEGDLTDKIDRGLRKYSFPTVARWLKVCHGATVVLPVRGYDHGSLRLEAAEEPSCSFTDRWDSGLLGLIYDTPEAREETGVPADRITEALADEVKLYDQWANGEMYGYVVEKQVGDSWEFGDSCGGFYSPDNALEEGKEAVPTERPANESPIARVEGRIIYADGETSDFTVLHTSTTGVFYRQAAGTQPVAGRGVDVLGALAAAVVAQREGDEPA